MYAARVLGPGLYGTVGVAIAVVLFFNRIVDGGFELGLGVREVAADSDFVRQMAPSVLAFRTLVAVAASILVAGVALLALPEPDGAVVAVQAVTLLAVGINARWIHLGLHHARLAAIMTATGQVIMAAAVLLWVRGPADVALVPTAQVVGDLAAAAMLLVALRRSAGSVPVSIDWSGLRQLLPRAWHLVASALLGIAIYSAGLLLVRVFRTADAAGHYTAAYALVTFFLNVGVMYNQSLLPSLTQLAVDREKQLALYHSALAHVFAAGLPLAIGGWLLAGPSIQLFFGTAFAPAAMVLGLLVWSIPLNLLRDVPLVALMSAGDEKAVLRVTKVAALISVVAGLALVPTFGLAGAAWATLLAEVVRMVVALRIARSRGFSLPPVRRFTRTAFAGLFMGACVAGLASGSIWIGVPLGVAAYVVGLAVTGGLAIGGGRGLRLTV